MEAMKAKASGKGPLGKTKDEVLPPPKKQQPENSHIDVVLF